MRLTIVRGPRMKFVCCNCLNVIEGIVHADLDGEAYKDYYCDECIEQLKKEEVSHE